MSSLDAAVNVTLANIARGVSDAFTQHRPLMNEMKKAGTIEYDVQGGSDGTTLNGGSYELSGSIEAGRHKPRTSSPGKDIWDVYQAPQRFKRWSGEFGEIVNGVLINRGTARRNKGSVFADITKTEVPALIRDTLEAAPGVSWQLLNMDANQYTGPDLPLYGLPTFLPGNCATVAADGQTVSAVTMATAIAQYDLEGFTPPTGSGTGTLTGSPPADTDKEVSIGGAPTLQNYLGLSCKAGALSGVTNAEWDAWTPVLVNSAYSGWTGNADDDDDAIEKATAYLVWRSIRHNATDTRRIGLMDRNFYEFLGAKKGTRETILIGPDNKTKANAETGFPVDRILHMGVSWFWDEQMPAFTAYCLDPANMSLKVQPLYAGLAGGSPLKVSGPDAGMLEVEVNEDAGRRSWLVNCTFPGQLICKPRYFGRLSRYSGTGV